MLVRILFFFGLFYAHLAAQAQSVQATFERAVNHYTTLQTQANDWRKDGLNTDELAMIRLRVEQGLSAIDSVLLSPSSADFPIAPYFRMLLEYERGYAFGAAGRMDDAYTSLSSLEEAFQRYSPSRFPMSFSLGGTSYQIQYANFAKTRWEYFVYMAELTRKRKEYLRSFNYAVMAKDQPEAMVFTRFLASYYYLLSKKDLRLISPEDAATCANHLDLYLQLSKGEQQSLFDSDNKVYAIAVQSFAELEEKTPNFQGVSAAKLRMARSLKPFTTDTVGASLIDQALYAATVSAYFESAVSGGENAPDVLREAYDFEYQSFGAGSTLAVKYLDQLFLKITSCADLEWVSVQYAFYSVPEKSRVAAEQAAACKVEQDRKEAAALLQLRKDQERLRKEAERTAKNSTRSARGLFWYAGWNVGPYLGKPRDLGFVLNVGGKKTAIEFSYLKVREKKENYFDLNLREINDVPEHRWDGFFAHTQVKFFDKSSDRVHGGSYVGLLLAYNERTFAPFQADVLSASTQAAVDRASFAPTNKQYIFMINYGLQVLNVAGMDVFMGIGAAYNDFNGGNATYWRNPDFNIDDNFIANRVKNYWSYTMRFGLTIGIGSIKR